jgi:SAM-dependent methyltransferase
VATRAGVARKARLAVGIAEALLQRPVRTVLDVGCGEAPWRSAVKHLRPGVRYVGVDSSEYVISRFGKRRNIRFGTFGALAAISSDLRGPFDLIVCCDVLQYVRPRELGSGLRSIASLLCGAAYLEAYTTEDEIEGDHRAWHHRSAAQYRRLFHAAGLTGVGMHCWVGESLRAMTAALERSSG